MSNGRNGYGTNGCIDKEGSAQSPIIKDKEKGKIVRNSHYIVEIPSNTEEVSSSTAIVHFKLDVALANLSLKSKIGEREEMVRRRCHRRVVGGINKAREFNFVR